MSRALARTRRLSCRGRGLKGARRVGYAVLSPMFLLFPIILIFILILHLHRSPCHSPGTSLRSARLDLSVDENEEAGGGAGL
jgi:hypothetical protein